MAGPRGLEADFMDRLNVYVTTGCVLLSIAVLVWLILRIRKWFIDSDDSDEGLNEILVQFSQLKRDGELSAEEYRLISQRLSAHQGPPDPATSPSPAIIKPTLPESESTSDPSGS